MKILCHSLSSLSKKDKKARLISIFQNYKGSLQKAFYNWVSKTPITDRAFPFEAIEGLSASRNHQEGSILVGGGRVRSKTSLNMAAVIQNTQERILKNPSGSGSASMNTSGSGIYYGNNT
jgi:hypothetical protein